MNLIVRNIAVLVALAAGLVMAGATHAQSICLLSCPSPTGPSSGPPSSAPPPLQGASPAAPLAGTAWNDQLKLYPGVPHCRLPRRSPASPRSEPVVGVNASLNYAYGQTLCQLLAEARATGASLVRTDLVWPSVESRPGVFDWRRYDAIFGMAARYGLTVLPIVDRTPTWLGPVPSALPEPAAYAAFVARVVARYGPGGSFWRSRQSVAALAPTYFELWNEPYFGPFAGLHPDPVAYARLVRAAVGAGRSANPLARYLIEAETTTWDFVNHKDIQWVDEMFQAVPDLAQYLDAVAVHPYSNLPPEYLGSEPNVRQQTRRLEQVHQALVRNGAGRAPVWITEIGWSTCPTGPNCISQRQQAHDYASLFHLLLRRWRYVRAVVSYQLRDSSGSGVQQNYGLLTSSGQAKPAWSVVRSFADSSTRRRRRTLSPGA